MKNQLAIFAYIWKKHRRLGANTLFVLFHGYIAQQYVSMLWRSRDLMLSL